MLIEHLNEGITNLLLSEPAFVVKDHLSFSHGILVVFTYHFKVNVVCSQGIVIYTPKTFFIRNKGSENWKDFFLCFGHYFCRVTFSSE